jgi:ATP-dependent phosphofructokinase / diphosphate-dependent phosphofructokinase
LSKPTKVLVITSGGDCPGLNAVLSSFTRHAVDHYGFQVIGSRRAYFGIMADEPDLIPLYPSELIDVHGKGGTILGTVNRGDPFHFPVVGENGVVMKDCSDTLIKKIKLLGFGAVVAIGGDGSQRISLELYRKGLPIIGVPKTIDNDLKCTDFTFGYQTAVEIATDAIDKLQTTARSHNRVMVLEVMGRDAGWIALSAGIAGGADIILMPEIPFSIEKIADSIERRRYAGREHCIIVVAEGAREEGGAAVVQERGKEGANDRLGGIGQRIAEGIKGKIPKEARVAVLGHLQRGGDPCAFDRILATQFGVAAVELVNEERWGHMVSYRHPGVVAVPIVEALSNYNRVDVGGDLMRAAIGLGIDFGADLESVPSALATASA